MKTINIITLAALFIGSFSSCDNELGTTDLTDESAFVEAYIDAESVIIHTIALIDEILRDSAFINTDSTILYDDIKAVSNNQGVTIFYGLQGGGTTFPDGILRSGNIAFSVSNGNYEDAGSITSITFDDFTYKKNACQGTVELTNNGALTTGFEFNFSSNNFEINKNTLSFDRTLLFVSDFLPLEKNNREFKMTAVDTTRFTYDEKNISADVVMVSPIEFEDICEYGVTSGELLMSTDSVLSGTSTLNIDFLGENDCANLIRAYSVEKDEVFFIAKRGF
ncbi:MAG: hypothetical protein LAT54_00210 [Cryomorphaceae bacterium]|nr:hypothetical protein [Cryomorphaceae bacterium]